MAVITIPKLHPIGYELFQDSETFLDELSDDWEFESVNDVIVSMAIRPAIDWQNPINGFLTTQR